jgi:hypothetical protein
MIDKEGDILVAMDSVDKIEKTILLDKTLENLGIVKRNSEHLEIIIKRHALEGEEAVVFNEAIEKSNAYLK